MFITWRILICPMFNMRAEGAGRGGGGGGDIRPDVYSRTENDNMLC